MKKGKAILCRREMPWRKDDKGKQVRVMEYTFDRVEITKVGRKYVYYQQGRFNEDRLPIEGYTQNVMRTDMMKICSTSEEVVLWVYATEVNHLSDEFIEWRARNKLSLETKVQILKDCGVEPPTLGDCKQYENLLL